MGADKQLRFEPTVSSGAGFVPPRRAKWAQAKVYRPSREQNVWAQDLGGACFSGEGG